MTLRLQHEVAHGEVEAEAGVEVEETTDSKVSDLRLAWLLHVK
jgi:hypothetical protein